MSEIDDRELSMDTMIIWECTHFTHIENCAKHPIAEIKAENERLREMLAQAVDISRSDASHETIMDQLADWIHTVEAALGGDHD